MSGGARTGHAHPKELLVVRADGASVQYPAFRVGKLAAGDGEVVGVYNDSLVRVTSRRLVPLVTKDGLAKAIRRRAFLIMGFGDVRVAARGDVYLFVSTLIRGRKDVIVKHIDAFNSRDSDSDPWASDAEFTAPVAQVTGRDDIIGFFGVFQNAFPDVRLELDQLLADGSAAAAEGTLTGTHDGVLPTRTAMSRRQDEPSSSGGRRSTPSTGTR